MKPGRMMKILAMLAALALGLTCAVAEELGEVDLYDPAVYVGDAQADPEPASAGEMTENPEEEFVPDPAEEPVANPVEEQAANPAEEPAANPEEDTVTNPAEEPVTDPVQDPASESAPESASEPSAEPEPAPEAASEPSAEPETVAEPVPEPEPVVEPEPAPESEPAVEPEPIPEPEPVPEAEPLVADADAAVAAPDVAADLRIGLGEQFPLDGAALLNGVPATAYASDHPEIVTVDAATGVITGSAPGAAIVTVAGAGASASLVVAVLDAPGRLDFSVGELALGKGEMRPLPASAPEGTAAARIAYASSKPKVAQVDAAGNIVAKKTGVATITATAYNGATATCVVRVLKAPSKLKFPYKTAYMCLGETRALSVTLPKKSASAIAWTSDNPGVVSVDAAGNFTGVAPGTATVTARSFNNKRATCKVTVLGGAAPTALSLNAAELALGKKETFQLIPTLGEGEAAAFAYASSAKRIASVSDKGVITAKKAGRALITVATHNGLTATVQVTVGKAPKSIAVSPAELSLAVGEAGRLGVSMPAGAASSIAWESSDPSVATVDAAGVVTGVKGGAAVIRATAFNGRTAQCSIVVTDVAGAEIPVPETEAEVPTVVTSGQMAANLRASSALGGKREAIAGVVKLLVDSGFEPAFAAGVGANIYYEGTYGRFESSRYVSNYQKRPRYFCYLDGGKHYTQKNGEYVVDEVYLSEEEMETYEGEGTKKLRFGEENFYLNNYSGKYVQDVNLSDLEAFMEALAAGKWQGKFGLGVVQWTGARTKVLVSFYRSQAGAGASSITAAQVAAAENEMILYDFRGSYKGVYTGWYSQNAAALATQDAARSAGSVVCLKYEIPADKETKAVTRGNKAAEIYNIMMGK